MAERNLGPESARDREIVLTREVEASPETVWEAWTDPVRILAWWGPRGFTTTTRSMDVRAGGVWRYVMHGPDGRDYENEVHYLEVERPRRLRYRHGGGGETADVNFETTVTFEALGSDRARTRVTLHSTFPSKEARDHVVREYGAIEGGKQTLERLGENVARADARSGSAPFTITRVVAAPRATVWKAWTQREHLAAWFGPKGFALPTTALDFRVGGSFHYEMRAPDGTTMWGKWVFLAIDPERALEFTISFSDPQGEVARDASHAGLPLRMLTKVLFADHAGKGLGTVVTVTMSAFEASAAEQQVFDAGHDSMRGGWTGTFEQLDAWLARRTGW